MSPKRFHDAVTHDRITQVRGYGSFSPAETERVAAVMEALDLELDLLERPSKRHSVTANVSADNREYINRTSVAVGMTPSDLCRMCLYHGLRLLASELDFVEEPPDFVES